jgi:hypothetical protein
MCAYIHTYFLYTLVNLTIRAYKHARAMKPKRTRKPKATTPVPDLPREIDLVDAETTMAMLDTLVAPKVAVKAAAQPEASLMEMKTFLSTRVKDLDHASKLALGNILVENNLQNQLRAHAQGVIINMESLPEYVIASMYVYASHKLR